VIVKLTAVIGSDFFSVEADMTVDQALGAFHEWIAARVIPNVALNKLAAQLETKTTALRTAVESNKL
jgi:hypothetical protein